MERKIVKLANKCLEVRYDGITLAFKDVKFLSLEERDALREPGYYWLRVVEYNDRGELIQPWIIGKWEKDRFDNSGWAWSISDNPSYTVTPSEALLEVDERKIERK